MDALTPDRAAGIDARPGQVHDPPVRDHVDAGPLPGEPAPNEPEDDEDPGEEFLDPRERQRMRRRDHDAGAQARDLMRPGMGKVFKQIHDVQRREADEDETDRQKRRRR